MQQKPRLLVKYEKEVVPLLKKEFGIKNSLAVPKISKVSANMGAGLMAKNKELASQLLRDLALITGQKPSERRAKVSIASFGIRRGVPVGLMVTIRGRRIYNFLDKLFSIVLPRLRDFRGLSKEGFDNYGNYTLGLSEHTVFPEIDLAKVSRPHGLEITIVIKGGDSLKSQRLLELLGMPFAKSDLAQGKPPNTQEDRKTQG